MTYVPVALDEKVKLCNCAKCRCELLGESMVGYTRLGSYSGLPIVHGRIDGRPYCQVCALEEVRRRYDAALYGADCTA